MSLAPRHRRGSCRRHCRPLRGSQQHAEGIEEGNSRFSEKPMQPASVIEGDEPTEIFEENCWSTPLGRFWPRARRRRGLCGMPEACRSMNLRRKVSSMLSGIKYGGPWISPFCMSTSRCDMTLSLSCWSHSWSSMWSWSARAS